LPRVRPAWGVTASGVDRLWEHGAAGLRAGRRPAGRVEAEIGYGLPALGLTGVLTPFARAALSGAHVRTAPEMGWAGVQNGELLRLAAPTFDVLLTVDSGIRYQQAVPAFEISVIELRPIATTFLPSFRSCRLSSRRYPRWNRGKS